MHTEKNSNDGFKKKIEEVFFIHILAGDVEVEEYYHNQFSIYHKGTKISNIRYNFKYSDAFMHTVTLPDENAKFAYQVEVALSEKRLINKLQYISDNINMLADRLKGATI